MARCSALVSHADDRRPAQRNEPKVAYGAVYVGSNATLHAVGVGKGDRIWTYETAGKIFSSPTVTEASVRATAGRNRKSRSARFGRRNCCAGSAVKAGQGWKILLDARYLEDAKAARDQLEAHIELELLLQDELPRQPEDLGKSRNSMILHGFSMKNSQFQ